MHFRRWKRREVISLLGGAAAAWPLAARAQQADRIRRIGFLMALPENDREAQARITAFRQGLEALGWTEGRNISIDFRFAVADLPHIQTHAAELVNSAPDVIVGQSTPVTSVLKQATRTIPIIFAGVNDPVGQGFVESLARPGGNITGLTFVEFTMVGKWLETLTLMAPGVRRASVMFNPETAPYYPIYLREFRDVPTTLAAELSEARVHDADEIEASIASLARESGGGLIVASDPFTNSHRLLIVRLAERHRLPAVYGFREFVAQGGLMSYGPDVVDITRRSAWYVDRILKGENPTKLPVQQPTKFELVINLKTAKALGLTVPLIMQMTADEVIE
jgi:putative tryptophan/tyrosine transport system substrate-binding protein